MALLDNFTRPGSRATLTAPRRGLAQYFAQYFALWRSRRALARLDAAALEDIGLSRKDALAEARRPVWDVPATWRN